MWGKSCTLTERAFEVTSANPGKRRQLAQFDRLSERVLNIVKNKPEPAA